MIPIHTKLESVDDDDIDFHGIVGASFDISDRRQLEDQLAFQALHDPLTGLPNRLLFVDHVDTALSRGARTGAVTALIFIDLDDFTAVNDRIGRAAADELLRAVGTRIARILRPGDVVARLGGDEFAVCCENLGGSLEAHIVVARIRDALLVPHGPAGAGVAAPASVGIALSGARAGAEVLLRQAQAAMYAAKEVGTSRVELFDDASHREARRLRAAAVELEQGLDRGEIEAWFQPQVSLDTGVLVGFEALARWIHPQRGMVPPAEFIPVAEATGLVDRIGRLMLVEACRSLASWLAAMPGRDLTVAVNVSAHQLANPVFPESVRAVIAEAGIPAARLCLEVTESALVNAYVAASTLRELKSIGVEMAIDDFGTGYSSLSRLGRFPVDYLKIDRAFVAGMSRRKEDAVIVAAVLGLAQTLGLRTVGEGIEEESQHQDLLALGCDIGQGYLWSPAVPATEAGRLVGESAARIVFPPPTSPPADPTGPGYGS